MSTLSLCPFCGAAGTLLWLIGRPESYAVSCPTCEALGPRKQTEMAAVRAWNKWPKNSLRMIKRRPSLKPKGGGKR